MGKRRVDSPKNKMMLFKITSNLSTIDDDHDMVDDNDGHPFHQFGGHGADTKGVRHEKKHDTFDKRGIESKV